MNGIEAQQVSRYIGGLKAAIRDKIRSEVIWKVEEAQNMALKAKLIKNSPRFFLESNFSQKVRGLSR